MGSFEKFFRNGKTNHEKQRNCGKGETIKVSLNNKMKVCEEYEKKLLKKTNKVENQI